MGSNLLGAESGLVARVARQAADISHLQQKIGTLEKELDKYKNMGRGIWVALGVAASILIWLVSNIKYIKTDTQ